MGEGASGSAAADVSDDESACSGRAQVQLAHDGNPDLTLHAFGKGLLGIYMGGFSYTPENNAPEPPVVCRRRAAERTVSDRQSLHGMYILSTGWTTGDHQ